MSGFDPTCYILVVIVLFAFLVGHLHHHKEQAMLHAIAVSSITYQRPNLVERDDDNSDIETLIEPFPTTSFEMVFQEQYFDWVSESEFFNED